MHGSDPFAGSDRARTPTGVCASPRFALHCVRMEPIIEQVHADLKDSALAHLPSGKFNANAAWLVLAVMAFNLTGPPARWADPKLARATTATIRRKLINVPARVATSARRLTLHLPQAWPWEHAWTNLFTAVSDPPLHAAP